MATSGNMATSGKRLQEFLTLKLTDKQKDIMVTQLQTDNRNIRPGELFIAYPGAVVDSRQFVADAAGRGAVAILAEAADSPESRQWLESAGVEVIETSALQSHIGSVAAAFYGNPSQHLDVVAVTGTNGKTSVTQLIAQALELIKGHAAVMGTLGNGPVNQLQSTSNTTPGPLQIQQLFEHFVAQGIRSVALEASSHGLEQQRLNGTRIRTAVVTNITRDHLDYHGTMESYQQAKERLVTWPGLQELVWNQDDPQVCQMADKAKAGVGKLGFSVQDESADLYATDIEHSHDGLAFTVHAAGKKVPVKVGLLGGFNVANLLAVIGVLILRGNSLKEIARIVAELQPIPGRMEMVALKKGADSLPAVLVDYAHTPDALKQALKAARTHCQGALWCVFGCGGDRDKGKRPLMGEVAAKYADHVVLTSDNPRTENVEEIFRDIETGFVETTDYFVKKDRKAAITDTIADADPRDWVLIAGKGHEDYQEINGERKEFSDVKVARKALKKRRDNSEPSCI